MRTANELQKREKAQVAGFNDERLAAMLLELGCVPGSTLSLQRKGYFHGPMFFKVDERLLAFRPEEARAIVLEDVRAESL